jgi:hypothetical protein
MSGIKSSIFLTDIYSCEVTLWQNVKMKNFVVFIVIGMDIISNFDMFSLFDYFRYRWFQLTWFLGQLMKWVRLFWEDGIPYYEIKIKQWFIINFYLRPYSWAKKIRGIIDSQEK